MHPSQAYHFTDPRHPDYVPPRDYSAPSAEDLAELARAAREEEIEAFVKGLTVEEREYVEYCFFKFDPAR